MKLRNSYAFQQVNSFVKLENPAIIPLHSMEKWWTLEKVRPSLNLPIYKITKSAEPRQSHLLTKRLGRKNSIVTFAMLGLIKREWVGIIGKNSFEMSLIN